MAIIKSHFVTGLRLSLFLMLMSPLQFVQGAPFCAAVFSKSSIKSATSGQVLRFYDKDGKPASNYRQLVQRLKNNPLGTRLDFGQGGQLIVKNFVTEGGTSFFIETTDGRFIKVFLSDLMEASLHPFDMQSEVYVGAEDFALIQRELKKQGVHVVALKEGRSRLPYYVELEKLPLKFTLGEFIGEQIKLSGKEKILVEERLIDWARTTWAYAWIGDFNPSQLGYTNDGWVLFDFGGKNRRIADLRQLGNTFSPVNFEIDNVKMVGDELYAKIENAIREERESRLEDRAAKEFSKHEAWFRRHGNESDDFLLKDEIGSSDLIGKTSTFIGANLAKSDRRLIEKAGGLSKNGKAKYRIKKIKTAGVDSVVFKIEFDVGIKGLLEVSTDSDFSVRKLGRGLEELGYSKSDWSAQGPDYILVVKH